MKYKIKCIHGTTGAAAEFTIDAATEDEALAVISDRGYIAEHCLPVTADPSTRESSNSKAALGNPLSFVIPKYQSLNILGQFMSGIGWIWIVLGVVSGLYFILNTISTTPSNELPDFGGMVFRVCTAIASVAMGIIYLAISEGLKAFRDIAINSWHTRNALERANK